VACLDSLKWNTEIPYELVFVDATPAQYFQPYTLEEISGALRRMDRPVPYINLITLPNVITAGEPSVKLAAMWNTGIAATKSDAVVVIPDDAILGWRAVDQLALAAEKFDVPCYTMHTDVRMPPDFKTRARALGAGGPQLSPPGRGSGFHANGFSFTRADWDKYGPFDTQFLWACIDDDWAEWLKWNGHAARECCTALIHHGVSGSVSGHMSTIPGFTAWIQTSDSEDRRRLMKKWHMGQKPARL
jgi:hypothetical protein